METQRMLVLSTGHLTNDTCNGWLNEANTVRAYQKGEYGWFVHVPEDGHITMDEDLPDDLRACVAFAAEQFFDWIMFDRDGDYIKQLPHYDW